MNQMLEESGVGNSIASQGKENLKLAILSIVILALVITALGLKLYFVKREYDRIINSNKANREKVVQLETISTRTKIFERFFENRLVALDVLSVLYDSVPNEIYLTNIVLMQDGKVSVQGVSDIASLVFDLNTKLKESPLFNSVEVKSTTAKKDRGKDVSAFEIALTLTTPPVMALNIEATQPVQTEEEK